MKRFSVLLSFKIPCKTFWIGIVLLGVTSSCYQVHSDDDLRGIPVTNNPNLIPNTGVMGKFTALNP